MATSLIPPSDSNLPALGSLERDRLAVLTSTWLLSKRSEHTRAAYRRDLTAWLQWTAELAIDPLSARTADVDLWIAAQRQGHGGKPAAESSIARRVSALASWYTYLIRNTEADPTPLVRHNPARTEARPRIDPDYSPTLGLDRLEVDRFTAAADADSATVSALIRLMLVGGLRVGSVLAAQVEDLGHDRGHRTLTVVLKRGGQARVAVPPMVGARIDAMLAERGDPGTGPLFVTPGGRPIYERYVYRLVRRLARAAGIATADQLCPHSLRHTAITELLNANGGDLRQAQDFAHHADPRTTRRYDRARNNLDHHGSYVLAGRFA